MNIQVVFPVLISFAISVILGPVIIPFLRKLKMGQTERVEGVQSHLKKAGTPTMGGVIFLIATAVTALFYVGDYPKIIPVLFLTLGFGIIGFLDDYLKVVLKRSDGLLAWQKFGLQVVVTGIFVFYILNYTNIDLAMRIPFWPDHYLNLGWLAIYQQISCDSGAVFCCDRYCKRCELYRWPGWTGFQRDFDRSGIFYRSFHWNKERDRTCDRSRCRWTDGIPSV